MVDSGITADPRYLHHDGNQSCCSGDFFPAAANPILSGAIRSSLFFKPPENIKPPSWAAENLSGGRRAMKLSKPC